MRSRKSAQVDLPILIVALLAGCASVNVGPESTPLPGVLALRPDRPGWLLSASPATIEARMRAKRCHTSPPTFGAADMAMGMSMPPTADPVRLDRGRTAEGARWFLLRDAVYPNITFCGVALFKEGHGTRVSLSGVPRGEVARATRLVESGEFLCRCSALAR